VNDSINTGFASALALHPDVFCDPTDQSALVLAPGGALSTTNGRRVAMNDGIPDLYTEVDTASGQMVNGVSDTVRSFYEETPFPNYDDLDTRQSLNAKARAGRFADLLDAQIPDQALVLEAGCGTGQLSNFLGMSWRRRVIAGDLCLNSLRLAKKFADSQVIRNVAFVQMNLFRPPFRDASFDLVISNGVLHHTADCEGAFRALLKKVKPGGHIAIGLYNYYGRLPTLFKRRLFASFGKTFHFLDPRLRGARVNPQRINAWFKDQYEHPHETRHSMDEVLRWFAAYGVDYVNGVPRLDGQPFAADAQLFEPQTPGTVTSRVATQLEMLLSGGQDGGLFIMIGRKR
jgi:SAM-dependent methyltransferase